MDKVEVSGLMSLRRIGPTEMKVVDGGGKILTASFELQRLSVEASGTVRYAGFRPNTTFTGSVDRVSVSLAVAGQPGGDPQLVSFYMSRLDGLKIQMKRKSLSDAIFSLGNCATPAGIS